MSKRRTKQLCEVCHKEPSVVGLNGHEVCLACLDAKLRQIGQTIRTAAKKLL